MDDTTTTAAQPSLNDPLESAAARTRRLLSVAEAWLARTMPATEVRFDLRGTAAGQARVSADGPAVIRYNRELLLRHTERFMHETVPHEVAHVAAFHCHGFGIRPHGAEWRHIMRHFGVEPARCHNFDVSCLRTRVVARFRYRCACTTHELSSIRHQRIRRHGIRYLCRRCRQPLIPI
ncbi:hypothetical protein CKO25_08810 [Thiocapsa imhoffii]|uniref:SprT-like domain-containing protein n=1 Tax=Thiocapsa imhoffii TaxID=382777 RepID=A0A9X0WHD4_9GAMM|nr:SprT-like domain-containing protein [Thiocapsa imhoffii]MBK1644746.1 hypothetical protein [Thiocapsa imhoffii]